jgi:hypothetical protein
MREAEAELARVAHHEAGHAVVAFVLGQHIGRVTITPDEDKGSAGAVKRRVLKIDREQEQRSPTLREERQLRDEVVARFAGAQAEAHFRGIPLQEVLDEGTADDDYEPVYTFAQALEGSPGPRTALLDYLQARAADLVELHWFLIEALAAELLARKALSGPAVLRLLRAMVADQPEAREFGLVATDAPLGLVRRAADWVGRERRGWDTEVS